MPVTMHLPPGARALVCTEIIEMTGARRKAGSFFMRKPMLVPPGAGAGSAERDACPMGSEDPNSDVEDFAGDDLPARTGAALKIVREKRRMPVSRKRVVTRLWRSAERQVAEIETRMAGLDDDPETLERDVKTLAIIAKTVRDLVAIDAEALVQNERIRLKEKRVPHGSKTARTDPTDDESAENGGPGPRDIEEFRAELARRLDELRLERGGGTPA